MATYDRLRKLFTDITLATIAMHAAACSGAGGVGEDPVVIGEPETIPCDIFYPFSTANLLDETIRTSTQTDFIAWRSRSENVGEPPGPIVMSAGTGTVCATATDVPACEAALAALPMDTGFIDSLIPESERRVDIVYTRGDEVGAAGTTEALAALLGPIDTAVEAALLARWGARQYPRCEEDNVRIDSNGVELRTISDWTCDSGAWEPRSVVFVALDGTITIRETELVRIGPYCGTGRLTDGLVASSSRPTELGAYFAEMAHLEATAVLAFVRLGDELTALGAPEALIARARVAADDERRHARDVGALAEAFGGVVPAAADTPEFAMRGAYEIALENAYEGCVRETYGALVAMHQAHAATDARVRDVLSRIARDETNHAAFSWDLAEWLETAIDACERASVLAARSRAVAAFRNADDTALEGDARATAGLPDAVTAQKLFAGLEGTVWA